MSGLIHAHSGIRWIVLALLIAAIVNAFSGWKGRKAYQDKDLKLHKFAMIAMHVQILVGIIVYAMDWGTKVGFSLMKGNPVIRFFTVEHSSMMLIAVILMTVGFSKSKKILETPNRFRMVFISYLIALIIIFVSIPWPFGFWAKYGGGWG